MDNLTPITREEMLMNDEPLTPITREEKILAGEDLNPVTRREYFLKKYRHAGGDVMVEGLEVTENGTYTAPEGKAYSPVEVAVPLPDNAYLLKEASGSLVSFSDGADLPMPSFVCDIDAVQDLHGYDAPWVGGAGKNIFNNITWEQGAISSTERKTYSANKVSSTTRIRISSLFPVTNGQTYTIQFDSTNYEVVLQAYDSNEMSITPVIPYNKWLTQYQEFTATSYVAVAIRKKDETDITPADAASANVKINLGTYSNICPISGHYGVDAWVFGKNRAITKSSSFTANNVTFTINADGSIKLDGTADATGNVTVTDPITVKAGTTYAVSTGVSASVIGYGISGYGIGTYIITPTNDYSDACVQIRTVSGTTYNITIYPQIEIGSQVTAYEPYNPNSQTIQVSWQTEAGEVYGGYIDLVSGVLTVTHGYIDLGTCEWLRTDLGNNNYRYYTTEVSNLVKAPSSTSEMPNIECSHYKNKLPSQYNQAVDGITIYTNGSIQVYDSTRSALTTTDFKTAMDGVQLVYELATPITYQLTPTQIKSLLGNNNAWCDTGDVDIDYFAKEVTG